MKEKTTVSLDRQLRKRIDDLRGDVPRSTYIEKLLRKAMEGKRW